MDTRHYDRFVHNRAKLAHDMLTDHNAFQRRKAANDDDLTAIDHGLNVLRGAAPSEFLNAFCDAAWQLAQRMANGS